MIWSHSLPHWKRRDCLQSQGKAQEVAVLLRQAETYQNWAEWVVAREMERALQSHSPFLELPQPVHRQNLGAGCASERSCFSFLN